MRYMYTHVFTIQFKVVWIWFRVACYFKKREFLVFLSFLKKKKSNRKLFQTGCTKTPEHILRFAHPNMYIYTCHTTDCFTV